MQKPSGPRSRSAFQDKYLAAIGVAVLLFASLFADAQKFQHPNDGTWGIGYRRFSQDSTLYFPTACGAPTDSTWLFSQGGQRLKQFAIYGDSCGHKVYYWDPSSQTWSVFGAGGGADSTSANAFYTKYRSDTSRANIYATISALIAGKKDKSDSSAATGYRSNGTADKVRDSLSALIAGKVTNSGGAKFLGSGTYASKPVASTGPGLYYAFPDSNRFYYSDGTTWTPITDKANQQFNTYVKKDGGRGINIARGADSSYYFKGLVDSLDAHLLLNADSTITIYVQAHDTTSPAALASKYDADTARTARIAAIAGKMSNNGASTGFKTGLYSARPVASNCQCYYGATDSTKLYYDNGAWITIGGGGGGASFDSLTSQGGVFHTQIYNDTKYLQKAVGWDSTNTIISGTSSTVPNGYNVVRFNPTTLISSYTLTFPTTWHTSNDLLIVFTSNSTISNGNTMVTNLTIINGSGQTLSQVVPPTTGIAGSSFRYHLIAGTIDQLITN